MTPEQQTEPLAPIEPGPLLGTHGEPCGSCGAPLAADQRYCVNCGARRADARLAFRDILASGSAPVRAPRLPAAGPPPEPAAGDSGRGGTLAALAGLGVTLLALGTGVVIGSAGASDPATAPAPQVITVGGVAAPAAAAPAAAGAAADGTSGATKSSKPRSSSSAGSSGSTPANSSLKKLENLSPQQYQKQSQKLPKVVGTGGAPPPKDNKPAAGGGDFQSIG
mgnify:CR=1 FL=1